jgi:hypothetical protein
MLPILDTQVRLVLLTYLARDNADDLVVAGVDSAQAERLRRLSATDLNRVAAMRALQLWVVLDSHSLESSLNAIRLADQSKVLEAYFIQHGASVEMMRKFFKLARGTTLKRRREYGLSSATGPVRRPERMLCERIWRAWQSIPESSSRERYLRLHQAFPDQSIAVLAGVVVYYQRCP